MVFPFLADDFKNAIENGVPNQDNPSILPESALSLPWVFDPAASFMEYRCWVECILDAGMVLHKPLPQKAYTPDTLASAYITDVDLDQLTEEGVNIDPELQIMDVVQRMATSTYRFVLKGYALRVGYQVPIPGIKTIGGQTAIPEGEQIAYNALAGSVIGGIPLWYARWELPYVLGGTPKANTDAPIPPNLAAHVYPDTELPDGVALPQTVTDMNAVVSPGQDLPIPIQNLK
jgi:hypothetical protein